MTKLFDRTSHLFDGPQSHKENSYEYYCRATRPEAIDVLYEMEDWFRIYPDAEKTDLKNTFKNNFDAGFFELFLFSLFHRMGYNIVIHPPVPNSNKTPDFLVSGFGEEFYLEAKVSYYESEEGKTTMRRLGTLYEVLDKADILDFFIYLKSVKDKRKKQPRANVIRRFIESSVNSHQVDQLYEDMNTGRRSVPIIDIYEDDDIYIEFGPIPKSAEGRGKAAQRAIGIYGQEAKILENAPSLRKALKSKASRYGELDKPYIIAINAIDMMALDINDVWDCLTGTTCVDLELIKQTGEVKEFRQHDGFFTGRDDQGQNTRVSAAMITKINPHAWKNADYWIIENEKARNAISLRTSSLITRFIQDGIIYRTSGLSLREIIKGNECDNDSIAH
ncbi:MAG: hypothetical protein EOP51_05540 [Sphingobacteriales bacterium]|nr:MAG: hypothetical protein EOP51_05540 [Sphingobacteriales bacterium]